MITLQQEYELENQALAIDPELIGGTVGSDYKDWLEQKITNLRVRETAYISLLNQCYEDIAWAIGMEDGLDGGQGEETLSRIEALIGETEKIREIKSAPCPDDPPPQGEISNAQ